MTGHGNVQDYVDRALKVASADGQAVVRAREVLQHQIRISNSEIDIFLSRFRYNFRNIDSARRWMKCFMFRNYLLRLFERQCSLEADSKAGISMKNIIAEPLAPFKKEYC